MIFCGNKAIRSCHCHNQSPGNPVLHHEGNVQTSYFAFDKYITLRVGIMPCSRRRRDVSQIEDYNIFKLVFRWEVHIDTKACQEQGISFLLVIMETIRGLHTVAKEHIRGLLLLYSLSRHRKACGGLQLKKF